MSNLSNIQFIHPVPGWGWERIDKGYFNDPSFDFEEIKKAGPFQVEIESRSVNTNEQESITGRVAQPGHILDGLWFVLSPHVTDKNIPKAEESIYDLEVGGNPPKRGHIVRRNEKGVIDVSTGVPIYLGFGLLRLS